MYEHRNSFLYGYPQWVTGSHMDEIYSVLAEPFMDTYRHVWLKDDFDEVDTKVKDDVISYFVNFAYTG